MLNRVILVGRITKDPEMRNTTSGTPVIRFTLAVNRRFTSQNGQREADFISCTVFGRSAENVARFVRKGALLGVEGRIQTGSYDAQDGTRRYTTDVICDTVQFLESRGQANQNTSYEQTYSQPAQNTQYNNQPSQPMNNQPANNQMTNNQNTFDQNNYFNDNNNGNFDITDDDLPF